MPPPELENRTFFPNCWKPKSLRSSVLLTRALAALTILLLSSCATSSPKLPPVRVVDNVLAEPDYGYSLEIPPAWKRLDEAMIAKMSPNIRSAFSSKANEWLAQGLRAIFYSQSGCILRVSCASTIYTEKRAAIDASRKAYESILQQDRKHLSHAFNKYKKLTDLNVSYDNADGNRILTYLFLYNSNEVLYALELTFASPLSDFDYNLPVFYSCTESVNVSDPFYSTATNEDEGRPISDRLQELKRLKDRGLITDEDFEKKKRQILNEL